MAYKHGIEVMERKTSFPSPTATRYGVQVIFGTAPVNLADDPSKAVNRPVKAGTFEEAQKALGYSDDWKNYTLCQSMYASYQIFGVGPVIFVNVLDPAKHVMDLGPMECTVENHQAVAGKPGILRDTVKVTLPGGAEPVAEPQELEEGKDFIMDFDGYGSLVITFLASGAAYGAGSVAISGKAIDPSAVTEEDIIGAYDASTGEESGLEVLRQVYPRHGIAPGMLLAPGWSEKPNVGAALQAKCTDINGVFRCTCLLDLDTVRAAKHTDCQGVKEADGYGGAQAIVLWPRVTSDGRAFAYSAVYGAMSSYYTAQNGDVPYLYPSNKELHTDGAVLDGGEEILLDQVQASALNGAGIVTAVHDGSWKSYGNNTGCYPESTDPKDRWIGCRRMFDYVGNYFATTYREALDGNMTRRYVDDIVNKFNIWGNSLVSSGMCAGLYAEYRSDENALEDILAGHMKLRIYFAPYMPAEYINAVLEFDVSALESAMAQEG